MARPMKTSEVVDRYSQVARFELAEILTNAALMKHYTAFIEAIQKIGGRAKTEYGSTVTVDRLKDAKELQSALEYEQSRWDETDRKYHQAVNRSSTDTTLTEWDRERLVEWAKVEGRPNPFDVFAANDPELQAIRDTLGMEE